MRQTGGDPLDSKARQLRILQEPVRTHVLSDLPTTFLAVHIIEAEVNASVNAAHADLIGAGTQAGVGAKDSWEGIGSGRKGNGIGSVKSTQHLRACFAEGAVAAGIRREWR